MAFVSPFSSPFVAPFPSVSVAAVSFLLNDEFTTDDTAPLDSPRTCEPGPGTLTAVVQSGASFSISGGILSASGNSASYNNLVYGDNLTVVEGLAAILRMTASTAGRPYIGLYNGTSKFSDLVDYGCLNITTTNRTNFYNSASVTAYQNLVAANYLMVIGNTRLKYIIGTKLAWVSVGTPPANMRPAIIPGYYPDTSTWDFLRAGVMGSPFNTDFGLATSRVASPAAGETTTMLADALLEMTWTAVTGQTWDFMFRRTDDNNCWIVRSSQAGSTVKLIEKSGGVETERSSAAQTLTNGTQYRLLVFTDGNSIRTYIDGVAGGLKNTYTSSLFASNTGVKTDTAGANLIAWPYNITGDALTEMNRWTA